MIEDESVRESFNTLSKDFEQDLDMKKIKEEVAKSFNNYRMTMKYMLADAPIEVLCLPVATEKILLDQGFLRIYDLFDTDFTEIKGFGVTRVRQLTACLDKFFAML